MKLSLNLPALERLIAGEDELEVEIRQNIAEAFAKRHLKTIINNELITKLEIEIRDSFRSQYSFQKINETYRDLVQQAVIQNVSALVHASINKTLEEYGWEKQIEEIVKERAEFIVKQWTDGTIERRIELLANQKIKDKLGLK